MQYRHLFHAGNFADVHKHVALLALVTALQKKAKGFLFLDTHAGAGLYDLHDPDARRSGESAGGIGRLAGPGAAGTGPAATSPAIARYLDTLARLRAATGTHHYPGSPLLAAALLRAVDRAVCVESEAQQARALQRALATAGPALGTRPRVITGDGYAQLKALLPPPERRALVLIDPPYERADEATLIAAGLEAALARFDSGVYAIWYPIKRRHDTDLWLARVSRHIDRPHLAIELCLREPDSAAGLNGSGLLVVNPPWQFDEEASGWQQPLHELLDASGGTRILWLRHESAP
jgi:23S rRNA (adenine2030-N6)-methyltransferase